MGQLDNYKIISSSNFQIIQFKNVRIIHTYPFLQASLSLLRLSFLDFDEEKRRDGFGFS
jgi:hypothetical protein